MHHQKQKQNFIQGAMILVVASLFVKFIGALYKIPLKNLIGKEGMGLFSYAYQIYNVMLVISTVGLPVALSKLVAEASTLGRAREVRRIVKVGAAVFVPLGALCTMLLLTCAQPLAEAFGDGNARWAVLAIAPSVLLVSIISVFRGYYQGIADMVPTAVSQVIEALGKLLVGLALAFWAMNRGMSISQVAACAIFGVTVGEAVSAGYLVVRTAVFGGRESIRLFSDVTRSRRELLEKLLILAIPVTISNSIMSLTSLIDAALMSNRLQDMGMTREIATGLYGIYNTMPVSLFNLPQTIIAALAVSIIPTISSAYASQNFTRVTSTIGTALRMGALISLPCGVGFFVLAGPILRLLFSQDTIEATPMLQVIAFAVPLVALVALSNAVLQGMGRADLSFISMFFGAVIKMLSEYALIGHGQILELGAPMSTVLCYAVIMLLNLFQISRLTKSLPPLMRTIGRPLAAALGMGAAVSMIYRLLMGALLDMLATLGSIAAGGVVYLVLLLALHAVEKDDVLMLPSGERIARFLRL